MADDNATVVFVYMGEGAVVPSDVVRVRVDPSVRVIPQYEFYDRRQLQKVELHDGIREIGPRAFSIGSRAFFGCNFTKFSDARHLLPESLAICSGIVKDCFPWSCQKLSLGWKAMRSAIVIHCGMLPSHPTLWLMRMLSFTVRTLYKFLARKRQLLMHYEFDLL
jgi:hypothetical protein